MNTHYAYNKMSFVWDEDKNEANIKKHKISFYVAAAVFDDQQRIEFPDVSHSEDEDRYITIGLVHDILTVVYCDRDNPETGGVTFVSYRPEEQQSRKYVPIMIIF